MVSKSTPAERRPSTDWKNCSELLSNFLESERQFLFVGEDSLRKICLEYLPDISSTNLDLVQFCTLGTLEKGALGIRELHWRVSNFIVLSRMFRLVLARIPFGHLGLFKPFIARYNGMISRKLVIDQMVGGLANVGIPIPHYIEPQNSSVIISRQFAYSLMRFNPDGLLDFNRACFALSRTSNFRCFRISNFQA